MSSKMREMSPDKPQGLLESVLVGGIITGVLILSAVITGGLFYILEVLYTVIGHWLFTGLPLTLGLVVLSAGVWRHLDPTDPFSLYVLIGAFIGSVTTVVGNTARRIEGWLQYQYDYTMRAFSNNE